MQTNLAQELLRTGKLSKQDQLEMWVDALFATGLDNWEGYDEAVNTYKTWLQEFADENV